MFFLISLLVIILDQASKSAATHHLVLYQPFAIMPMLNFTLAYNTGAAFSFLNSTGAWHHWFFMGFSFLVSLVLIVWISRLSNHTERLQLIALSLILPGAVANLIDRISLGYVIDFIQIYYKHYYWPIFNIADSAITVGTVLLAFDLYTQKPSSQQI